MQTDPHDGPPLDTDGLTWLLSLPRVPVTLTPEESRGGRSRLRRFSVRLPLRYRLEHDATWHHAVTENMSRTGLLFHSHREAFADRVTDATAGTSIDLQIVVPAERPDSAPIHVRCAGQVVRTVHDRRGTLIRVAAAVGGYHVHDGRDDRAAAADGDTGDEPSPTPAYRPSRRFPRAALQYDQRFVVEIVPDSGGRSNGQAVSVGFGGAFLATSDDYREGTRLRIRFRLPPTFSEIMCTAVVRNRAPGRGVGVAFSELSYWERQELQRFVARHTPPPD